MGIGLGDNIRRKRKQLSLTQEDLAELSNLSVNFISKIERTSNQNINLQKLDAIAEALNISSIDSIKSTKPTNKNVNLADDQNSYFFNKLTVELKKLPKEQSEEISKYFLYLIKSIRNK
ncbi:MAG: helix-turn-helix domain-containing protein [Candidatus Limosilactobacillus merdavium]|uniref:Helix-turn-helix domain-containing protein n=1 Tax=Candidatus Limosilactobacillus merdavium TaxID=2838651 RepID=A0A9E2KU78_9LACO|nr:helix-turn-helix domain-containing protein [Candidatus Limosilactobacillus merdavium]